jgi:myo-inositol-1(or 4)-monophosphatase
MSDAVIATGIPFLGRPGHKPFLDQMGRVMAEVAGIRRMGAASLDLAYVAAGRYEGFWETGLQPWDIAAGVLLVREAGGFATDYKGGKDVVHNGNIVAANGKLHKQILDLVTKG